MYKVVIPTAGIGSRIGPYTKFMNKALVTIGTKPAIAHIIEKFDDAEEIIILLGYKGDHIRQVVRAFFPDMNIKFVDVDVWEGPGSGLGRTLSCAKNHLQCPFIFISNDTVIPNDTVNLDPDTHGNWMGWYDGGNISNTEQYRTLNIKEDHVVSINPKGVNGAKNIHIGLVGVKDYEKFWKTMDNESAILSGESYGMQALDNITAFEMPSWCDIGNIDSLSKTKKNLKNNDYNILEKENEAIWFSNGHVIKFSVSESFISDRITRLNLLDKDLFPNVVHIDKNLYVYDMIEGNVLSKEFNSKTMLHVLNTIGEKMWFKPHKRITEELIESCYAFYRDKTYDRVKMFHDKYEVNDRDTIINGNKVPSSSWLLDNINWDKICKTPYGSDFHGDFHNENILISKEGDPILIDWRQNFGKGNYEVGDVYYDLAKFNHGLIVSHSVVDKNLFTVEYNEDNIKIDIMRPSSLVDGEQCYYKWLESCSYDVDRVKILTALIYLNIAALHEYPYSIFLYYLGKEILYNWGKDCEYTNW